MQRIRLAVAKAIIATAFSGWIGFSSAIELGPIQLVSKPGEAFQARIDITDLGDTQAGQLLPGLAPKSEFDRLGVPRSSALADLTFELVPADDQAQVIIRSTNPINDLALEFLLELYSPNSRIVKAYSLLFDPPADAAPMPLSDQIIEVGQRTLWSIAREVKPEGADINQTMLALLNTNPDVFERQNINGLIPGSRLQIPTAEALASIPAPLAKQLVEQQHEDWANGVATSDAPVVVAVEAPKATDAEVTESDVETVSLAEYQALQQQIAALETQLVQANAQRAEIQNALAQDSEQANQTLAQLERSLQNEQRERQAREQESERLSAALTRVREELAARKFKPGINRSATYGTRGTSQPSASRASSGQ